MSKRDEFVIRALDGLQDEFDTEQLKIIESILIECISDYEVEKRCTDIVEYGREIPEWYMYFLARKKIAGRSDETLKLYNRYILDFFVNAPAAVDKMDGTLMLYYLYECQKRLRISNRTLDQIRIILNTFFAWAAAEGYVQRNFVASIDPIKYVEKSRQPLTEEEVVMVREACDTYRERAIIDVFLSTGVRLSELVGIKWSDIDMNAKTIQVFGKGSKFRTVMFDSQTKVSLLQYKLLRAGNSDYVFLTDVYPYRPLKKGGVSAIVKQIASRTNITAKITPHIFRHTFATHALERGMSIDKLRRLLGHESISTTEIYTKVDLSQIAYEYRRAFA